MSTQTHTFVVWAPDNEGAYEKRMAVRGKHVEDASQNKSLRLGGAMLTPESITGGDRKLVGSMLLIEATTLEEVEAKVKQDVYWTNDVWDKSKLVILPFAAALGSVASQLK